MALLLLLWLRALLLLVSLLLRRRLWLHMSDILLRALACSRRGVTNALIRDDILCITQMALIYTTRWRRCEGRSTRWWKPDILDEGGDAEMRAGPSRWSCGLVHGTKQAVVGGGG